MRLLLLLLLIVSTVPAFGAEIVSNCDRQELAKTHPVRVAPDVGRKQLVSKSDISIPSTALNKFQDARLSLDVVATESGGIDCFMLSSEKIIEFTDADKDDLRGAIATGLQEWHFEPYFLNGKVARMLARFPMKVDHRQLVIVKPTFPLR